mmetsp:Transcript_3505/g.12469  ORF Transcript_3505/g.12469 Transcript_3505/m.12469 type:complete len:221 (+) Transcript_3505:1777-2439(+)
MRFLFAFSCAGLYCPSLPYNCLFLPSCALASARLEISIARSARLAAADVFLFPEPSSNSSASSSSEMSIFSSSSSSSSMFLAPAPPFVCALSIKTSSCSSIIIPEPMVSLINAKSTSSFSGKPAITVEVSFLYAVSTSNSFASIETNSVEACCSCPSRNFGGCVKYGIFPAFQSAKITFAEATKSGIPPFFSFPMERLACLKKSSTSAHFPVLYVTINFS